jgi:iron complex outermembrane receptor protein
MLHRFDAQCGSLVQAIFYKGVRVGIEWQKKGSYYLDSRNAAKYGGYNVFHMRVGYELEGFEVWMNVINAVDSYNAYIAGKTASGYSYTPAESRHFNLGVSYDFGNLFNS